MNYMALISASSVDQNTELGNDNLPISRETLTNNPTTTWNDQKTTIVDDEYTFTI